MVGDELNNDEPRTLAELDQALSENLDEIDCWFEELVQLAEGDGLIAEPELHELARLAAATCTILIGIHDLQTEELNNGFSND